MPLYCIVTLTSLSPKSESNSKSLILKRQNSKLGKAMRYPKSKLPIEHWTRQLQSLRKALHNKKMFNSIKNLCKNNNCLPACLPACLLSRLLACLLASLPACLPTCLPALQNSSGVLFSIIIIFNSQCNSKPVPIPIDGKSSLVLLDTVYLHQRVNSVLEIL